eukprot:2761023-Pyramimonas_sp.AAC.1
MRARQAGMPRARGRGLMKEDWRIMRKRRRKKEKEQHEEKEGRIKKGILILGRNIRVRIDFSSSTGSRLSSGT